MRLILALLIALPLWPQTFMRVQRRASITAGASYLFKDGFDASGPCGDGVATNCENTFVKMGLPIVNFAYATAPAPLDGTKSLRVQAPAGGGSGGYAGGFTAQDTVYWYAIINHTTLAGGADVVMFLDSVGGELMGIRNANPEFEVACGTTLAYSTPITAGVTYHFWGDYTKGTGTNAVCHLYHSTTSTKPGSPNITISTGTGTTQASYIALVGNTTDVASVTLYDKIRVSTSAIGSTPE